MANNDEREHLYAAQPRRANKYKKYKFYAEFLRDRSRKAIVGVYGMKRRHWYHVLPSWFQHLMVIGWNYFACWKWGHDDILWHLAHDDHDYYEDEGPPRCVNCMKVLTGCTDKEKHSAE